MYFYQNRKDFVEFWQYLQSVASPDLSFWGRDVSVDTDDVYRYELFYVLPQGKTPDDIQQGTEDFPYIQMYTTCPTGVFLQCGCISLYKSADKKGHRPLSSLFNKAQSFVRENYERSDIMQYYVGPSFYEDWRQRNVLIPTFIHRRHCIKKADEIDETDFISYIISQGYHFSQDYLNVEYLGRENIQQFDEKTYIIFPQGASLKYYTRYIQNEYLPDDHNRRFLFYTPDSQAVFMFKEKKKNKETKKREVIYEFLMDERLADGHTPEVEELFRLIEAYSPTNK